MRPAVPDLTIGCVRANAASAAHGARLRLDGILAGTPILTRGGYRPVESLRPGDQVFTLSGAGEVLQSIVAVGARSVSCIGNSRLAPVRVRGREQDVWLAPDHAV
ncbi:MAG: Hint domain-containing protein [Acetobacteraceae bacterium]